MTKLRDYGVPSLEERKKEIYAILGRGDSLSVFQIMSRTGLLKSCAYNTLKNMSVNRDRYKRVIYYSSKKQTERITVSEKRALFLMFMSTTERRCAEYE